MKKGLFILLGALFIFAVYNNIMSPQVIGGQEASELVSEKAEPVYYQAAMFGIEDSDSIITFVITALMGIFGAAFGFVKAKLTKIVKVFREAYEAFEAVEKAMEDDKLTKAELTKIKSEFLEVIAAGRLLFKKEKGSE